MKKGRLFCEFTISGTNLKYLIGYLQNKSIGVFNYVEVDDKTSKVLIDYTDRRKFFAICKNMCYNIKYVKYKGMLSPFIIAYKNIGLIIGLALFIITALYSSDYILRVDVGGSYYESEILSISKDYGVDVYKKFSKANISGLKQKLLSLNPSISFISIDKKGNTLNINVVSSENNDTLFNKNSTDLLSPVNGVIESVSVLRGTALVEKGQEVSVGTPLIGAYTIGKEDKIFPTYIVGRVTVLEKKVKFYKLSTVNEENIKTAEAILKFNENDEVVSINSRKVDGGIEVLITIRHVIVGG